MGVRTSRRVAYSRLKIRNKKELESRLSAKESLEIPRPSPWHPRFKIGSVSRLLIRLQSCSRYIMHSAMKLNVELLASSTSYYFPQLSLVR